MIAFNAGRLTRMSGDGNGQTFWMRPFAYITCHWHNCRMRHQIIILAALGVALFSSTVSGKEHSEDECLRLQPSITSPVEMTTCTSDLKGSERALNDALNELLTHIPTEYRAQLEKSQHTWTDYRNELCLWEAGGYPGSTGQSSAVIACTADMNRKRAKYLHDDLKDRW